MAIISDFICKGKKIIKYNRSIIENITIENTNYHFAKRAESTGICEHAVEEPIYDMRIDGNSIQGILPSEYQQVEYLEGTGTQYIEIDYIASSNTKVKSKYQITDPSKAAFLFGARSTGSANAYTFNWGGTVPYKYYNVYQSSLLTSLEVDTEVHELYKNKNELYIDNNLTSTVSGISTFTTAYKMIIFACHSASQIGYLPSKAKIYYIQFFDNEELKVDLIPCYRKADNKPGMFDLVTNTFYTNLGTDEFIVGDPISMVDYPIEIESVGDKTRNLFNEELLLLHSSLVEKTEEGYLMKNYPVSYHIIQPTTGKLVQSFKNALKPGVTYTLSRKTKNYIKGIDGSIVVLNSAGDTIIKCPGEKGIKSVTFSLTQEQIDSIYTIRVYGEQGETPIIFEYIQLEEGEIATEYEPYGYKVPVKVRQNLFDVNNYRLYHYTIDATEIWPNSSANTVVIPCEVGRTYIISIDYNVTLFRVATVDKISTDRVAAYNIVRQTNNEPITITAEQPYLCVQLGQSTWDSSIPFLRIETDFIINMYLNEPLRKIGEYADYIDYKNKKVVRNIQNEFITTVISKSSQSSTYSIFLSDITQKPKVSGVYGNYTGQALSNKFIQNTKNDYLLLATNGGYINSYITTAGKNKIVYSFNDTAINTVELAQEAIGSGFDVYYILDTPIEEPIEISEIRTQKGLNNFSVDTTIQPSEFKVTYWKQIGTDDIVENIVQTDSNILIISTGADITQDGSNLLIGG